MTILRCYGIVINIVSTIIGIIVSIMLGYLATIFISDGSSSFLPGIIVLVIGLLCLIIPIINLIITIRKKAGKTLWLGVISGTISAAIIMMFLVTLPGVFEAAFRP